MSGESAADLLAQVQGESAGAASAGIVVSASGLSVADQYTAANNPALYAYARSRQQGTNGATANASPPWLLIAGVAGAGLLLWFILGKRGAREIALSGYRKRSRRIRR